MSSKLDIGIVYVLTNSVMPGLVKIGMTTRKGIDTRMRELYGTGVPVPFECAYACEVASKDCAKIEKALHRAFAPYRINVNREFFKINVEQAVVILELFNKKEITEIVSCEIESELTPEDKDANEKVKSSKRPVFNFEEMNIVIGAVLKFVKDENIEATVVSQRLVSYNGQTRSLTSITKELLNAPRNVSPLQHWNVDGKNLRDIYDETYPLLD